MSGFKSSCRYQRELCESLLTGYFSKDKSATTFVCDHAFAPALPFVSVMEAISGDRLEFPKNFVEVKVFVSLFCRSESIVSVVVFKDKEGCMKRNTLLR